MIGGYPWASEALLAASLRTDGTVTAANPALERFAGHPLAGEPFGALVAVAQREAFARRLAEVGNQWRPAVFALQGCDGALGGLARFHAARPVSVVAVACHAARWVPQRGRA